MTMFKPIFLALLVHFQHHTSSSLATNSHVLVDIAEQSKERNATDVTTTTTTDSSNNGTTCAENNIKSSHSNKCRVWVAKSTLPGSGIGMFAGDYLIKNGDEMMRAGDHTIPIVDLALHHPTKDGEEPFFFMWNEYTWDDVILGGAGSTSLGVQSVSIASPGFGAIANSFIDFVNVDEDYPVHSVPQEIHRSKDPGAGAFTYYHSRMSTAMKNIQPGEELFVDYGNEWFLRRQEKLGPIPILGDHKIAFKLFQRYKGKIVSWEKAEKKTEALKDMWDMFVLDSAWEESSRAFAALPPKEDYTKMEAIGLIKLKQNRMVRSVEWLEENGICADNFYMDSSTLQQAGHGAFASRFLAKGTAILPIPLIHIPDRNILDMYDLKRGKNKPEAVNETKRVVVGKQLLLNYCLGHANSTMLLSPYGPILVNHNQTLANVRLQWALPERSNHHPEMLKHPVDDFYSEKSAKLAMEFVALKDIQPGEELFVDYGDEWENAWQEHLRTWKPVPGAEHYISAEQLNNATDHLKTEFEQMFDPYPGNVGIRFDLAFLQQMKRWQLVMKKGGNIQEWKKRESSRENVKCEILRYSQASNGRLLYTAVIPAKDDDKKSRLVEAMPREAFTFVDRPYTSDMFMSNVFRHDIRIPDDIFPSAWKNLG